MSKLLGRGAVSPSRDLSWLLSDEVKEEVKKEQQGVMTISIDDIVPFKDHPFKLYTGQRLQDMTSSIEKNGVLNPIIVRKLLDGSYECLAGHNRHNVCKILGITNIPAYVKENITDEEALVYVIETNLMQRSFSDMLPSEKALVLFVRHEKLVQQGRREDIIKELENLEKNSEGSEGKPCNDEENSTCGLLVHKLKSRDKNGVEYGLDGRTVARYLRIHKLLQPLKDRIDNDEIALYSGVELSYLSFEEQEIVEKILSENEWYLDMKKAKALRTCSNEKKLDEEKAIAIISGEINKKKSSPSKTWQMNKKTSKKLLTTYFKDFKPEDIDETIEEAVEYYFANKKY